MKQKHMTKETRERIEKGIREGESLKEIARAIDKDPTTVSKEVLKRRSDTVPVSRIQSVTPCVQCTYFLQCRLTKICSNECPNKQCRSCFRVDVPNRCSKFVKAKCKRLERFPYVCNGCPKRNRSCTLQKYEYIPMSAQRQYEKELHESRQGLNLTSDEFKLIDKNLKRDLIKDNLSTI